LNSKLVLSLALTAFALTPASHAGQIRKLQLTEDRPATVILALGRSTAISFLSRPEKVVPGSPQAIQINFLGSDLTVTPVGRKPGNLLVYTKSGRYVILFSIGTDAHYDDVVRIGTHGQVRPIRLLTDSYHLASLKVSVLPREAGPLLPKEITVQLTTNEREISGSDLDALLSNPVLTGGSGVSGGKITLHCSGCLIHTRNGSARMSCVKPIEIIHCESKPTSKSKSRTTNLELERSAQ
jgi:hypothetical protein